MNAVRKSKIIYVLIVAVMLLPLATSRIMTGGILSEWVARVEELSWNLFLFFPSEAVYQETGINDNAFHSNLFFYGSVLLYRLTKNMFLTYFCTMFFIQLGTFFATKYFCKEYFGEQGETGSFFCMLLYLLSPYRMYVCYDRADLSLVVAWMLLPIYAGAILCLIRGGGKRLFYFIVASLSLAGIGYAHVPVFLLAMFFTVLLLFYCRAVLLAGVTVTGTCAVIPALYPMLRYLLNGEGEAWGLACQSIMPEGYRLGSYFCTYQFFENCPGIGLGMMLCMGLAIWGHFVHGGKEKKGEAILWWLGILFFLMASRRFPWELVQRLCYPLTRLVGLWKTPGVFFGFGYALTCVPAGGMAERILNPEEKEKEFADLFGVLVFLACLSVCVYQCNTLTS